MAEQPGQWNTPAPIYGQRPHTLAVPQELSRRGELLARFPTGDGTSDVFHGREVVWLVTRLGQAGIAMRGVYSPDGDLHLDSVQRRDGGLTLHVTGSTMGRFRGVLTTLDPESRFFRWQTWPTPAADLLMPPQPWNVYPIDADGDPLTTRGVVYAAPPAALGDYEAVGRSMALPRTGD